MIKRFFILLLAIVASVGMSFAQASIVSSGTKGGMSYTFYDNGLLEISGSGALPGRAFTNWDGGFGTSVKNIRFAEDCEVYGLGDMWFGCYTENSQLETVEINSVVPIMFSASSGEGIFYRQDGAVTLTITAPGIVDVEGEIIGNYGSPVNMILNLPATTVFEKKWFSGLRNNFAVTIPTGATGHIPAGYVFKDSYNQDEYDHLVADNHEDIFWHMHSDLVEGVDYTLGVESTFVITAENASQIFGQAAVSFKAPTEASNSEWVLWRKSDLKEFPDMSSGDQKVCKDVTVKVNNGVYNTDSGWGLHFESSGEDGVQFVAPEGKVFKRIVILNEYGTFSDPNWSYDGNYKKWSGSANTVGFVGNICGISLIEFELEASAPANSCGDGLTWELNNGELVISYDGEGTGVMNDYDIPNDNHAPWYANRENITSVSLPEGIKTIGKDAFRDCVNLTTVTIPNSVTTIGESAFVTVEHLETVKIGTGITSIVNGAFYGNAELTTVTCSATTPPSIGEMVFGSCQNLEHIYVPTESVDAYKTAWSAYASIISAPPANSITINGTPQVGDNSISLTYYFDPGNVPGLDEGLAPTLKVKCVTDNKWDEKWLSPSEISSGTTTITLEELVSFQEGKSYDVCFAYNNGDWVDDVFQSFSFPATPAYETVTNLINEIPDPVVLTAECKAKIDAARAAYDALSDGDKDLVTNSATLTTAEAAFENVMNIWLSGDCDVILWKDTTLTVRKHAGEGNGAMADYNYASRAPWYNSHWNAPQPGDIVIKSVTIEEGVTHLGDYAFAWMSEMKTVTIPASVTTIPKDAFFWSKAVDDIYLTVADPSNLTWTLPNTADVHFKPEKGTRCHVPADLLTAYQEKFGTLNVTFVGDLDPITPLTPEQQQALDAAKDKIAAIPSPVVYTPACKDAIDAARAAYDALTPDMLKQLVSNYATLSAAEATYANLKDVAVAEAKIAAIPQPVTLKLATRDSIESARAAYEALNADQQALVSNYDVLTAAEATWAGLINVAPAGALSGKYTINDGGDVIYFAHGNLQYTRENLDVDWSTGTFRLATNQYDLIEADPTYPAAYCTDNYGDKTAVGLFGWGTWGEGKTPNLTSSDRTLYTWSTDFSGTLEGTSTWRTLTKDEWVYLLAHSNQSYATVHGVNGLLVAPDGKDIDGKSMADWVEINDETWTTMQNDGYLFLPACGQRSQMSATANITTGDQGEDVVYYSSTQNTDATAYNIWYKPGQDPAAADYSNKRQAFGVRLVSAGVNPLDQVQVVKGLIEAIPAEITLDAACVNAIQSAHAAYDALDTDAKAILDAADVKKLTDAEQALKDLNQAEADEVIAKINAIPTPVELKLATRDSINNARAAYDALNAAQQALVPAADLQKLTNAETELASLNPGVAPATPLDSAQAVKDLIGAIREPLDPTEACGAEIAAALNAYDALSNAAKGALDAADVQKLTDAATQYPALDAIAAIDMIPAEITYDPMTKSYIEIAKAKYDALSDASKALVPEDKVNKLTNALEAWAILAAKIEHNVSYIGKDGELKNEKVALLHIPDPAPDFNGYEFVRWDVKGGDFLVEGLRIKAVYTPLITTNPAAYDTLVYNGTAQELVKAGVAKEGHIEYSLYPEEPESWSAELPQATFAAAYVVYYKLVREGHEDYMAGSVNATIAKAPVTYTAPTAVETLVYNASNQTLIAAGQTNDGTFEYTLAPDDEESWNTELPQAKDAGTYSVYYRVQGDLNHLDSTAVDPIAVTIAKAELTATADNKAIIFGELAPQFTVTYAGWQGEDEASDLTGDIAYATPYVRGNNVGEYMITPSGVDAANYTITFVDGTLTVNRKSAESSDIMAAQEEGEQLVYTNAVNKPTLLVKDTTLTLTEEKDYTLTFVGRGETQYAESATAPIHVGDYTAIVAFVGNYKDTLTVDFAIAKAPLTITADDKENIFGEEAPEFTVSYEGFLGTDTATVLTGTQEYACEYVRGNDVGDYTIVPSGVDAHDYVITFVNGTLTVNRKSAKDADIVAAQLAGEKLIYTNAVNRPTIVVTDTTLTLTEEKDYVLTFIGTANDASVYAESAVAPTKAGDYTAIVAFVGNYIDTLTVDFTISKAPLTITANDTAMIYGDNAPAFTVRYDGFLGTDDNSVLLGTQGYSCSYAPGSYIGTYAITPKDVEAYDYAITFVNGTLTVNKAVVSISGAEAQCAKFADGHAQAVVLQQGTLNGIKLNDPIAHVTTAAYSSADVAEHLTVTLFYELTGDAALLTNYDLQPTSEVFSTEGVIIEPMIPDDQPAEKEDEETEIEEGIEVYAYGYCDGSGYSLRYHLETGIPDQYKIEFADSRFTDVDWTNLEVKGPDGHINILIPVDLPTGDYTMTVTFRDSRFVWLESKPFDVTFHVNLPETFITPLFNNTIALVDTCNCFTDIQWYWRADDTQLWQPIEGATGHYYHVEGKLTGEYFVQARMNGEPTYTCGQADMETLYGAEKQQPKATVKAFPNPVVNTTTVTIENSENWNHSLRVVNLTGVEMFRTTFEGNETVVRMDGFVQGNYMISVDGIVVKVMKQ